MAIINFGVGVSDARGSVGGHTFTKGRFGAVLRQKVSPVQPRTTAQLAVRSLFTDFAKAWGQNLTDVQRAGFIALAASNPRTNRFGNPNVLTGAQLFQSINRNLSTVGVAELDDAPADLNVDGLTSLTLTATFTASVLTVDFLPSPLAATDHLVITATPNLSPGKTFISPFLKLTFADPAGATAGTQDIFAAWNALFGALQPGQKVGISAFVVRDTNGASSAPATTTAIVGA
jgi:hypothetical protein